MVAVTLGLDSGSGSGNGGGVGGNASDIIRRSSNETFLSLSSNANLSSTSSEVDDYDEVVVVVADQGEIEDDGVGGRGCENGLQLLLIIKTGLLAVSLLLEIFMARLALRGTMWNVQPRRLMEYVLYSRLRTDIVYTLSFFLSSN